MTRPFIGGPLGPGQESFAPVVSAPIHDVAATLIGDMAGEPALVTDPLAEADDAALGYLLAAATADGDHWRIDRRSRPIASDQVALALLAHDIEFFPVG
ncbi:MAG: hypothetical protein R2706_20610 [Acidimicrobiales bacterium]